MIINSASYGCYEVIKSDTYMKISFKPFQVINEHLHNPSFSRPSLSVHINEIELTLIIQILQAFAPGLHRVLCVCVCVCVLVTQSCLTLCDPMDREARPAAVHGVTKSQTRLSD